MMYRVPDPFFSILVGCPLQKDGADRVRGKRRKEEGRWGGERGWRREREGRWKEGGERSEGREVEGRGGEK